MKRRIASGLTVADLTPFEETCLTCAWSPGEMPDPDVRWRTWGEFLDCYQQVRDELREMFAGRGELFAETVLRFRDRFGAAALLSATSEDIRAEA